MTKPFGSTRMFKPAPGVISQNRKEYDSQMSLVTTDVIHSYFSNKSGGYMVVMRGHSPNEEEFEVGRFLADFGLKVRLTPEGAGYEMYATHSYVKKGKINYKFPEGKIDILTFEQRTPDKIHNTVESSVHHAIMHANSKHAEIALIYDKYKLYHREDIENGMKLYQKKFKMWETKGVKVVLVVSYDGGVFEHQFDKE